METPNTFDSLSFGPAEAVIYPISTRHVVDRRRRDLMAIVRTGQ